MKLTRREAVVAGVALSACGRSELYDEDDGLAARDPEADDVGLIQRNIPVNTSPVHLTAHTTIDSNSSGGVNAVALKNPIGAPMEIHEIKWSISGLAGSGSARDIFGGIIACKLDLGTVKLTNGFVPVWNFGRPEDLISEVNQYDDGTNFHTSQFLWRLPRPLYIPAGTVLTPSFQHRGLLTYSYDVRISYAGRTIKSGPVPKKVYVPYVASYVSPNFDYTTGAAADSAESTETDLVNTNPEPLHLQRFVGRLQTYSQVGTDITTSEVDFPAQDQRTSLRMIDSNGRPIVRNFTPFRQVFAAPTRTWDMDNGAVMDPQSYYRVFLRADPTGLTSSPITTLLQQAHISMVGWRELSGKDV